MSGGPVLDSNPDSPPRFNTDQLGGWHQKYTESLANGLRQQLNNASYSDVVLSVDGKSFKCHKIILSSISPYFEAMFSSDMKEATEEQIHLHGVTCEVFSDVLLFMYTGTDVVNVDNVSGILQCAALLQVQPLIDRCEDFMLDKIDSENCIATWKLATGTGCHRLAQRAFRVTLRIFPDVWRRKNFREIDSKELIDLISDNNLNTPNEETVCDAALSWVEADVSARGKYIADIVEVLRLPLMQPEYLLEVLERKSYIKDSESCRNFLEEAKRYHLLPARRQEFISPRLEYRNSGDFEEVVVCIGGSNEQMMTSSQVMCYSFQRRQWYDLALPPYNPGVEFATCGYGNAIFISGGSTRMHGMICYLSTHNKWHECQTMLLGRRRHMMVSCGDCIYVLGGYEDSAEDEFKTLLSIEAFQMSNGTWEDSGYLTIPVRSAATAVSGEHIYIFGGVLNSDFDSKAIQCFDTRNRCCSIIGDLPSFCRLSVAISYQHKIFIVHPTGEVMQFDEDKSVVEIGKIPDFDRHNFGMVLKNGCILIAGGCCNDGHYSDEIIKFDLSTKTYLQTSDYLPSGMCGFGFIKVVMHKKYHLWS